MRKALLTIFCLLFIGVASSSFAQQEWTVTLIWTPSVSPNMTETRMYIKSTPGIVPDGNPQRVLAPSDASYALLLPAGNWYVVVTAYGSSYATPESSPSNEVHITLPPPVMQPGPHSNLNYTVQ